MRAWARLFHAELVEAKTVTGPAKFSCSNRPAVCMACVKMVKLGWACRYAASRSELLGALAGMPRAKALEQPAHGLSISLFY